MKRLRALALLVCLAACSPVAPPSLPPPSPEQPPEPPPDGIPECLQVPNRGRAAALPVVPGVPIRAVSGELYYRAELPAGNYSARFDELFDYDGMGFFAYQEADLVVAMRTEEFSPSVTFDFELEESGVTVFRLNHVTHPRDCETYLFTLDKRR